MPDFGKDWVARVVVRTDGKRVWLRMWHECPPGYCEQGEFEAVVYGKPPDAVYALEVVRRKAKDVLWIIRLRPHAGDPDSLLIQDDRRAGKPKQNPHDNQASFTALKRIKQDRER